MAKGRVEKEIQQRQLQENSERVMELERQLREARRECAALQGQLSAAEEV